jgi:hypothetical protein
MGQRGKGQVSRDTGAPLIGCYLGFDMTWEEYTWLKINDETRPKTSVLIGYGLNYIVRRASVVGRIIAATDADIGSLPALSHSSSGMRQSSPASDGNQNAHQRMRKGM